MQYMVHLQIVDVFAGYHVYPGIPFRIQPEHRVELFPLTFRQPGKIFIYNVCHIFSDREVVPIDTLPELTHKNTKNVLNLPQNYVTLQFGPGAG